MSLRVKLLTAAIAAASALLTCQAFAHAEKSGAGESTAQLERQLKNLSRVQNSKLNLAETSLEPSRYRNPKLNASKYLAQLDDLASAVKSKIKSGADPEAVIDALREAIYTEKGFRYMDDVDEQGLPQNAEDIYLHGTLESKRGYCMTLSLIYLIIGEKLKLPLYGVALPNHFFVRYDNGKTRINIETTEGGVTRPDSFYLQQFPIPEVAGKDSYFMRNLNKKKSLAAYYANVGTAAFKEGKTNAAIAYLSFAATVNPSAVDVQNNLGNIYSELKKFDRAIAHYREALKSDPNNASTLFNLGTAYADAGDKDDLAIETLLQVLQIDPGMARAHAELLPIFLRQKKFHAALLHIHKLLELDPENLQLRLTEASLYSEMDQFELALEVLRNSQEQFPENDEVLAQTAEIYYRMEDYDKALFHYRYLLERNPEDLTVHVQIGWTYYRKGDASAAISWTRRGLSLGDPDARVTALAQMNMGFYHVIERKFAEAEFWYKLAVAENLKENIAGMMSDLQEARERYPELSEVEYFAGWIYNENGERDNATQHLRAFLQRKADGDLADKARSMLRSAPPAKKRPLKKTSAGETAPADADMARIPAGIFTMGSDSPGSDEYPAHSVMLDEFYIDRFEVTALDFADFLNQAGNADNFYLPNKFGVIEYEKDFHPRPGFDSYPVNNVSWFGASAYCRWKNKRLPTEAEWEKAARGADARTYPWGNDPPSAKNSRFLQTWSEQTGSKVMMPVDSMPEGRSSYGLHHMAGNVKEWVNDWYLGNYYSQPEHAVNPAGPVGGEHKVLRGGSWHDLPAFLSSTFRNNGQPNMRMDDYGFRCARGQDATPADGKRLIRLENQEAFDKMKNDPGKNHSHPLFTRGAPGLARSNCRDSASLSRVLAVRALPRLSLRLVADADRPRFAPAASGRAGDLELNGGSRAGPLPGGGVGRAQAPPPCKGELCINAVRDKIGIFYIRDIVIAFLSSRLSPSPYKGEGGVRVKSGFHISPHPNLLPGGEKEKIGFMQRSPCKGGRGDFHRKASNLGITNHCGYLSLFPRTRESNGAIRDFSIKPPATQKVFDL